MSPAATASSRTEFGGGDVGLPLRQAQRAFAALIEAGAARRAEPGAFRVAQLRGATRRTLSALSADDRARLQRWLALQLATGQARAGRALARVDAMLAAQVGNALARTREELAAHGNGVAA